MAQGWASPSCGPWIDGRGGRVEVLNSDAGTASLPKSGKRKKLWLHSTRSASTASEFPDPGLLEFVLELNPERAVGVRVDNVAEHSEHGGNREMVADVEYGVDGVPVARCSDQRVQASGVGVGHLAELVCEGQERGCKVDEVAFECGTVTVRETE